jgi:hypothetical protein
MTAWLGLICENTGDGAGQERAQPESAENQEIEMDGFDLTFPRVAPTGEEKPLPELVAPDERIARYGMTVDPLQSPFFEIEKRLPKSAPRPLLDRIAVSRQLATYGYFCYGFHAVSMFWSISCIEMALKLKFREVNPGPFRLVRKTKDGIEETTEVAITFLENLRVAGAIPIGTKIRIGHVSSLSEGIGAFGAFGTDVGIFVDDHVNVGKGLVSTIIMGHFASRS